MKIRSALIALCLAAVAGGAPGTAHSRSKTAPVVQDQSRETMTQDANVSAQATTDISYGGTADTHGMSGTRISVTRTRTGKACWPHPSCDIPVKH
jgi:hypothetical protein